MCQLREMTAARPISIKEKKIEPLLIYNLMVADKIKTYIWLLGIQTDIILLWNLLKIEAST